MDLRDHQTLSQHTHGIEGEPKHQVQCTGDGERFDGDVPDSLHQPNIGVHHSISIRVCLLQTK